jgi:ribosomal protein L30E
MKDEDAIALVDKYFEIALETKTGKYMVGHFEAYELIAKGNAILDVITRPALNKNQKKEIVKIIKEL